MATGMTGGPTDADPKFTSAKGYISQSEQVLTIGFGKSPYVYYVAMAWKGGAVVHFDLKQSSVTGVYPVELCGDSRARFHPHVSPSFRLITEMKSAIIHPQLS